MENVLGVLLMIGWFVAIAILVVSGLNAIEAYGKPKNWPLAIALWLAAALLFAIPVGLSGSKPLCAKGHEDYRLVGKTYQRVWICDQREVE